MNAAPPKWHEGPIRGFDTETTGVNPLEHRIVTAAIVTTIPGQRPTSIQWLIDPGMPVPEEAAAVHGWTAEKLEAKLAGHQALRILNCHERFIPKDAALFEIAAQVGMAMHTGIPLVVANAAYDMTLLETELVRVGVDTLSSRPAGITGIVDPQVLEKAFDPYRKVKGGCRGGKHQCRGCGTEDKTLGSLCAHYGVPHVGAHDANGDALAAVRLARRLASLWPQVAAWKLGTLHAHQVTWRRDQADSLREYFDRSGIEHDGVDPGWPLHTKVHETPIRQDLPPAPRPGGGEHLTECAVWSDRSMPCTCDDFSPEWTVA